MFRLTPLATVLTTGALLAHPALCDITAQVPAPMGDGCPDPAITAEAPELSGFDLLDISIQWLPLGGPTALEACGLEAAGGVTAAPTWSATLTDMEGMSLSLMVPEPCATALLVRDAGGAWHLATGRNEGAGPFVELSGALSGRIDVWVAAAPDSACEGRLRAAALTGPAGQSAEEVAALFAAGWRVFTDAFSGDLALSQGEAGWTGTLSVDDGEQALTEVTADPATGRLHFTTDAGVSCEAVLTDDYLDGACIVPDRPGLTPFEAEPGN